VTTVNKANMLLWVQALESGEFEQGTAALRQDDKFCCLGVACELARRNGAEMSVTSQGVSTMKNGCKTTYISWQYGNSKSHLPEEVQNWLGIRAQNPMVSRPAPFKRDLEHLTTCNDSLGMSFLDIAAAIRNTYLRENDAGVAAGE